MRKTMFRWLIALAILLPCMMLTAFAGEGDLPTADTVSAGQYVLDRDVTLSGTLSVEGDVVIDLNGRTLNGIVAPYFTIDEGGKLTIKDSSAEKAGKIVGITAADYMVEILSGGEMVLENGALTGHTNTNGTWDVGGAIYNGGVFTMTGGAITGNSAGENGHGGAIRVDRGSVTTISGGEISGNAARRGGAISTGDTAFQEDDPFPTINITGGLFTGNIATNRTPTIYTYMTNVTISGGVFDQGVRVGDAVNYPDGIWTRNGTTTISGGELEQLCVGINRNVNPATMFLHIIGNPVIKQMDVAAGVEGLTATIGTLTSGAAVVTTYSANAFTVLDDTVWVGGNGTAYFCAQDTVNWYQCGNNIFGTLEDGELTISGTGAMWDFENNSDVPWYDVKDTIKMVTIKDGVTLIGTRAFQNCVNLSEIAIPATVRTFNGYAAYGCINLTTITVAEDNPVFHTVDGVLYSKDMTRLVLYPAARPDVTYTMPDSVTMAWAAAFAGATDLQQITLSKNLQIITADLFRGCTSLTSIEIPDSVTGIGDYAFRDCTNLTSVTISDNVATIGGFAFDTCSSLTSVEIPDSVTAIGIYAFRGCYRMTNVTIPDSVTTIGYSAFQGCAGLTSVTIGDSVTTIGNNTFRDCGNLTRMEFLGNAPTVGNYVFSNCNNLTIYYHEETAGWPTDGSWQGVPLVMIKKPVQSTLGYFSLEVVATIVVDGQTVEICRWVWTPFEG